MNFVDPPGLGKWRRIPGFPDWDVRNDPSAGGGDPPHRHFRKKGEEYGRRVYDDGSQKKHGKGKDKDVPQDVIDATKPCDKSKNNSPYESEPGLVPNPIPPFVPIPNPIPLPPSLPMPEPIPLPPSIPFPIPEPIFPIPEFPIFEPIFL